MNHTEQRPLLVTKFTPVFQVFSPRFFVPCSECITKRARPVLELEMFNLHMLIYVIPVLGIISTNGGMISAFGIECIFHVFRFYYGIVVGCDMHHLQVLGHYLELILFEQQVLL